MNEIYVAHQVIFNKNFNRHAFYHNEQKGCCFDSQFLVSKEVVLLTRNKDGKFCYLETQEPCHILEPDNLQKSITVFECRFCSKHTSNGICCKETADLKSEVLGVVNIMPISEFTKIGYIPMAINLVNEYNSSVKGELEPITNKSYNSTITKINSGFARRKVKNT